MMPVRLLTGGRPSLHPCLTRRQGARRLTVRVNSLTLPYQYQARADKLRKKGVDVVEFGERTMREGCFGEDVLQLQNYLSEEAYYNPVNGGYTGYFGAVTRDALIEWQKDQCLELSGVFDAKCKWAYLRQQEQRLAQSTKKQAAPVSTSTPTPVKATRPSAAVPTTQVVGPAAPAAAKSGGFNFTSLVVAAGVVYGAYQLYLRRHLIQSYLGAPSDGSKVASAPVDQPGDAVNDEVNAAAAHESRLRKLSEQEVQRYLAPMKGEGQKNSPLQRPPPMKRNLQPLRVPPEQRENAGGGSDPFLTSKYGTYYGGKQVLEKVKEHLGGEAGKGSYDAANAAARRLAALSTLTQKEQAKKADTQQRGETKPIPQSPPTATSLSQPVVQESADVASSSFEDVELADDCPAAQPATTTAAAAAPVPSSAAPAELLAGTDLEKSPMERPVRPVQVQRPARLLSSREDLAAPSPNATNTANGSTVNVVRAAPASPRPRPVPVVKPNQPTAATIGEAMEQAGVDAADLTPGVMSVSMDETVVLKDRPIKIHKPARLVNGAWAVPQQQWESAQSSSSGEWGQ